MDLTVRVDPGEAGQFCSSPEDFTWSLLLRWDFTGCTEEVWGFCSIQLFLLFVLSKHTAPFAFVYRPCH